MRYAVCLYAILFFSASNFSQDFWEQSNGPYGGKIFSMGINNNGDIYTGCSRAIYRSTDEGSDWLKVYDDFALDNSSADKFVFQSSSNVFVKSPKGLLLSTDDGINWEQIGDDTLKYWIRDLAINSSDNLLAATNYGLYSSADNGITWTSRGLEEKKIYILYIDKENNIYAGTKDSLLFRSTNEGETWKETGSLNDLVKSIFVRSNGEILVSLVNAGLFRSSNEGNTWSHVNTPFGGTDKVYENQDGDLFASLSYKGVYKSPDNGNNWEIITTSLDIPPDFYGYPTNDYDFIVNSNGDLFVSNDTRGLYRSYDNGNSWSQINQGIKNAVVWTLAEDSEGNIYAGIQYEGIYKSSDHGTSWTYLGLNTVWINAIYITADGKILAGTEGEGLYSSIDEGNSWVQADIASSHVYSFAVSPQGYLFAGSNGIFRSSDNGETWPLHTLPGFPGNSMCVNSAGTIFTSCWGVYRSTAVGVYWTFCGLFDIHFPFEVRTIKTNSQDVLFAGTENGAVFRSSDDGNDWTGVLVGPYGYDVHSLDINSRDEIFAGTLEGVYHSADNGDSFEELNQGLNYHYISSVLAASDGYIYASSVWGGVYRSINSATGNQETTSDIPISYSLSQNYPNPFNPTTTLSYKLAEPSFVSLKVYDVLGEEAAVLVSEEKPAGKYSVSFDGSDLASGVYFYELRAGGFVQTKKMLLLK